MLSDSLTFGLLQNALSASSLSQSVYASNIANADVPGYKAQSVEFQTLFQNALSGTPTAQLGEKTIPITTSSANALLGVKPIIVQNASTTYSNNGNNVDVAQQMEAMAQNQLRYNALAQDMSLRFQRMKTAIMG